MDSLGKELLDFLSIASLKKARYKLYKLLNACEDEINIYYIVSLSNLKNIIADGGIKCRAMVGDGVTDLSGHSVQTMRNKSVQLAQKVSLHEDIIYKKIHECINLFWNPLNKTLFAFQRNSLLKELDIQDNTYGVVCILELKLSAFFESDTIYWSTSKKNLASYSFSTFYKKDYEKFSWQDIFSTKNDTNTNQTRSAEFIVFYKNPELTVSDLIPIRFIRRIIVPAQCEAMVKEAIPSVKNQIISSSNPEIFQSKKELLKADKYFIINISNLQNSGLSVEKFCELINTFSKFSELLGCSLTEKCFERKYMAYNIHGIGHVTRVMFWAHVFCYLSSTDQLTEKAVLYSAFIHDLCRENNSPDEKKHGRRAVLKHENFLNQKIPENFIDSCMNAVLYHCRDDNECPDKDLLWQLLKDADSLDRGRFGSPRGLSSKWKKFKGCDVNYLRLKILRDSPKLKETLAWMSYWLAQITHHTMWTENTYIDIKNEIEKSLKASLRNSILEPKEREIAEKMLGCLCRSYV